NLSWRSATTPNPGESNPRVVFERMFGEESDPTLRRRRMQDDRSILDAVKHDVLRLNGKLPANDRTAVDEYLTTIRDVERRIQKAERQSALSETTIEAPSGIPDTYDEHVKLMFDLLLLAYQADMTRVATFPISRELAGPGGYPWIGVPEDHHETSHHQNNPEKIAKLAKINTYHMSLFAEFVAKMRDARDGDGS